MPGPLSLAILLLESCRVGAGSVVLKDVPDNTSVAGIPAKDLGEAGSELPAITMEQKF